MHSNASITVNDLRFLTGARGIAALLIVFYHVREHLFAVLPAVLNDLMKSGYLAVDFFFFLSGFILAWKYTSEFSNGIRSYYVTFITKRLARLLPIHVLSLLAFTLIPLAHFVTERPINSIRFGLDSFLAKLFLVDVWGLNMAATWNVPSWSISAEMFVYLGFPLLAYFLFRGGFRAQVTVAVALLVTLGAVFHGLGLKSLGAEFGKMALLRCAFEFTAGMCVCYTWAHFTKWPKTQLKAMFWTLPLALVGTLLFEVASFLTAPAIFIALLAISLQIKTWMHAWLEAPALQYLGDISYSLYMNHYWIKAILTMFLLENSEAGDLRWLALYVGLSLGISALTHKFVEVPGRIWMSRLLLRPISR